MIIFTIVFELLGLLLKRSWLGAGCANRMNASRSGVTFGVMIMVKH